MNAKQISVWKASVVDFSEIESLHIRLFSEIGQTKDSVQQCLKAEYYLKYIATIDSRFAGYFLAEPKDRNILNLSWIGTVPDMRRRGVADTLMDKFEELGNGRSLELITRKRFPEAIDLYQKRGYIQKSLSQDKNGEWLITMLKVAP